MSTRAAQSSIPADFRRALRQSGLDEFFEESAYVPHAEYVRWILAARQPETRRQRIRKAVVRLFAQWREEMRAARSAFESAEPERGVEASTRSETSGIRRSA